MANKKQSNFGYQLLSIIIVMVVVAQVFTANGHDDPLSFPDTDNDTPEQDTTQNDTTHKQEIKTGADTSDDVVLQFPLKKGNHVFPEENENVGMNLQNPSNVKKEIEYDEENNQFLFNEKVGNQDVKPPSYMDFEEYYKYRSRQDENTYWQQRLEALSMFNKKPKLPELTREGLFDRLFGGTALQIEPRGNLDLTFGGNWQNMKNPHIPVRAQKYGIFDFDMMMNISLMAQIGDKMKLNLTNNTKPTFGEQDVRKIEYTGQEDEIIKKIEAGNVSFPLRSSLAPGVQTLFGLKTQLQFGKLWVTGVMSQQKSQRRSLTVQGGGQFQQFEINADDYDENRNFLLAQYFYENYDKALERFPLINSQIVITKLEVWVTNRSGATQGVRDVLSLMDLGEKNPHNSMYADGTGTHYPDNNANRLYSTLLQNPGGRVQSTATQTAITLGLTEGRDFARSTMRQLNPNEYSFHPQLGYVTLNAMISPDDVLAVAFRYTLNGKVYQVGEFGEDMPPDTTNQKVMYLKQIKGVTANPQLPIWNLMMKNVYSIGSMNISKEDFRLNVLYMDPGGGNKRYIPEGLVAGVPLITLLNLDRLNPQNDPFPDGVFDYVEGITVISQSGKVIFPVLEPFGKHLKSKFDGDPSMEKRYLFEMLYDSTKTIARQFQKNNRFLISGTYKGAGMGAEIYLGTFNMPQGSVTVTAGGQTLVEGTDYQVNYGVGSVTILNQGILNSGLPLNIQFEDNGAFSFMQQNFWGLRADYLVNDKLTVGGTLMRLSERPFSQKTNFGEDPIKNTVLALDANYQSEFPALTRALDKMLPYYSTTAPSMLSLKGEVAGLFPGHHRFVDVLDPEGSVYLDNFEGANSAIDLRLPATNWFLASTPADAKDPSGITLFPEAVQINELQSGMNRAKISWYSLESSLVNIGSSNAPQNIREDTEMLNYWRLVQQQDVFPNKSRIQEQSFLSTFDLTYYPYERGPYNFSTTNIDPATGRFSNPRNRWAGIQRAIENHSSDFEASNVEYITFWMMDPFIYHNDQGYLYLNLGNVSEDVLKDGRLSFENGTPFPKDYSKLDETVWGFVPRFQQQLTRAFSTEPEARAIQDVGYDALNDDEERERFNAFLQQMEGVLGANSEAYQRLLNDPASDNYRHFRGEEHDNNKVSAIRRYKDYNGPHGNSPVMSLNEQHTMSGTTIPESEDINRDNALNESEAYYQYRIALGRDMPVGSNHIVDKRVARVKLQDGSETDETWYQFKIPIRAYDHVAGGIADFRSIRFMRMFLTGFTDSVTLRFAQLQLERNQWRQYLFSLMAPGENIPEEDQLVTTFSMTSVGVEQNSGKVPVPYRIPPGVRRVNQPAGLGGQNMELDEQSLSLQVCGLKDGDARAAFKAMRTDLRQFDYLRMFVHASAIPNQPRVMDDELEAFVRIGSDFTHNYYEYRIPLKITPDGSTNSEEIWMEANRMNIRLQELVDLKTNRDAEGRPAHLSYLTNDEQGYAMLVLGNPNLADVRNIMLGIRNPKKGINDVNDDGMPKCVEVWFNELRAAGMNEKPGYAAAGQASIQLADLGNVNLSGVMHTIGYGNINQKLNERYRDNFHSFDMNTNLNLGKLLPRNWGVQLPVYFGYSENVSNPQYDPYDRDTELKEKLEAWSGTNRDSVHRAAQDFMSLTSFNMSDIRFTGNPEKPAKVMMPWNLQNFNLSYSYSRLFKRNPLLLHDEITDQKLGLNYNYRIKGISIEPFKKRIKSKSKWLVAIKDLNFSPLPESFVFKTDLHRIFGETQVRNVESGPYEIPTTYFKDFVWRRTYNVNWNLTKSISLIYQANNSSRIDEPYGRIDTPEKRDSMMYLISKFGRNTHFNQELRATYRVPTRKIPIFEWTNMTVSYNAGYNWLAASRVAMDLGNEIANTQAIQINGDFQFSQLYNKSRWLRAINTPKRRDNLGRGMMLSNKLESATSASSIGRLSGADTQANDTKKGEQESREERNKRRKQSQNLPPKPEKKKVFERQVPGYDTLSKSEIKQGFRKLKKAERKRFRKEIRAWRERKRKILPEVSEGLRAVGKLATMLKRVNINYSENAGTILPGFMDSTTFVGVNHRSDNSWYDFVFGRQPNIEWLDRQAMLGRISQDSIFNGQLQQQFVQNYNIQATLEPVSDMRIELNWTKKFSKNYTETFKFAHDMGDYQHYSPYTMGSFNISFIGIRTMFGATEAGQLPKSYLDFMDNRKTVSRRLSESNPYTAGMPDPTNPDYGKGYTQYSQDVLIPAFLAAYSGRNANSIPLLVDNSNQLRSNPFKHYIPMPNWKLTYNGLSKIPSIAQHIANLTITHNYTGTMSMNSFVSSFYYQDLLGVGFPSFIDSISNNYVPFFQVPNITISENFSPVVGLDIAFHNSMSFKISFNKSRMLSMSLIDYQISETKSTDIMIGGGHRLKGMNLPFSVFGINRLENDINIRLDVGYRDDITTNTHFAQNESRPTLGQRVLKIAPTIDYIVNDNLQIMLYYERNQSIPYVDTSFPLTNTRAGIRLRFLFTE